MRNLRLKLFILFLAFSSQNLNGQPASNGFHGLPFNPSRSVLFGKDIVIVDEQDIDQQLVAVCSAFNGWLYAFVTFQRPDNMAAANKLLKSVDGGITWVELSEAHGPPNTKITRKVIVATGNSPNNLKLYSAMVYKNTDELEYDGTASLSWFNAETGAFEGQLISHTAYDVALTTDNLFPVAGANPGSLGYLYSRHISSRDSLIFLSSSNGGISLDNRQVVDVSQERLHNVSLAYGRSPTFPEGRYFAVWESAINFSDSIGTIFTSHSDSGLNSSFTTPVRLDNLDPSDAGVCSNPRIACQYNNSDNDSLNFTEVVLFEKNYPASHSKDIVGYSNLQAATSNYFNKFSITNHDHNNVQPEITFNPYTSEFMTTYCDNTDHRLPFLTNNINLVNPSNWTIVNPGYNDSPDIFYPYPKISLNYAEEEGMNVWITGQPDGKGKALFDAPYSTYTGISNKTDNSSSALFKVFPNPCDKQAKIRFLSDNTEWVSIELIDLLGQSIYKKTEKVYSRGIHQVTLDTSRIKEGSYILLMKTEKFSGQIKLLVAR